MATAINAAFGATTLRAASLVGGWVNVLDTIGGVGHTVDVAGGQPDVERPAGSRQ